MAKKGLVIGGAVLAGAIALGPYVVGMSAEKLFRDAVERADADVMGSFELLEYKRGWFSSDAKLTYKVAGPDFFGQGDSLPLNVKVGHGPVIMSSNGIRIGRLEAVMTPDLSGLNASATNNSADGSDDVGSDGAMGGDQDDAAASAETAPRPSGNDPMAYQPPQEPLLETINRVFEGREDGVSLVVSQDLMGATEASLIIQSLETNTLEGDRITFEGGEFTVDLDDTGWTGKGSANIGQLKIDKGVGQISISPISVEGDFEQEIPGLYLGEGEASVDEIVATSTTSTVIFKDVSLLSKRGLVDEKVEDETTLSFGNIESTWPVTSARVVQTWKGVNPDAYMMVHQGFLADGSDSPEESIEHLEESVNALLQPGLSYGLEVELNSGEAAATADVELSFDGTPDGSAPFDYLSHQSQMGMAGMGPVMNTMKGVFDIRVDQGFIGALGPFGGMIMQPPYFIQQDNQYVSVGKLENGVLTMNDAPMPLFPTQPSAPPAHTPGAMGVPGATSPGMAPQVGGDGEQSAPEQ